MSEAVSTSVAPRRADDTYSDAIWLCLAAGVLVLSALLQTKGGPDVAIPWLDWTLPDVCHLRRWTGIECAGCGLTRSFIRCTHGDLVGAWEFHPIGPFLFVLVALQLPYRGWQLWRIRSGRGRWRASWWWQTPLVVLLLMMMARWLYQLAVRYL